MAGADGRSKGYGSAASAGARLPPAMEHARALLADRGGLTPGELAAALRAAGFVIREEQLAHVPERWPEVFWLDELGRLTVDRPRPAPASGGEGPVDADGDTDDRWWQQPVDVEPLPLSQVMVVAIDTTGLSAERDEVRQIATVNLGTGERMLVDVGHPDTDRPGTVNLATALARLDEQLAGAAAVAGHLVGRFTVHFLAAAARRERLAWQAALPSVDLHSLSLIVDPTLVGRGLAELADHFDLPPVGESADDRAVTSAELLRRLLDRYDPTDPTWALARACLARAGDPLARLLPAGDVVADLAGALQPRPDDLVSVGDGTSHSSATAAVVSAFDVLRARVPTYRDRPSQRAMSDAVARVLDRGGRLAVEAPTGTGKSLAYLVPAAGRAARPSQPVVVATKTKLLQRQLREDAARLRSLGLLRAPFRQVQGVGNYICTREVGEAVEGGQLEGSEWLALAVAVRALALSPNGLWDDVTDGLQLRSDLRYARQRFALRTTPSSCERRNCAHADRCPLLTRLEGLDANPGILSVNHAVVASWVRLADEGAKAPGDVLSDDGAASLVLDEAHDLEESLTSAWTDTVDTLAIQALLASLWRQRGPIARARTAGRRAGVDAETMRRIDEVRPAIEDAIGDLGDAVAHYVHEYGGGEAQVALRPGIVARRPEFKELSAAASRLRGALMRLQGALLAAASLLEEAGDESGPLAGSVRRAAFRLRGAAADVEPLADLLEKLPGLPEAQLYVYVVAVDDADGSEPGDRWSFRRVPIEIGDRFADRVAARAHATVLTSATLAVGDRFDFLGRRLGIEVVDVAEPDDASAFGSLRVDSPFAMDDQSTLVLTSHLPLPVPASEQQFCEDFASDQVGFVSLTGGRTLTLFAARRRMEIVAERVRRKQAELAERGVELLVQGEEGTSHLTRRFVDDPGSVLYGLRSFWEGFDAPGETLSYLVIEKPPYPHPGDPLVAARQQVIADRGGDPFLEYVVPRTAITLAQGFGRLIRTESDHGAALVADRRLQLPTAANALLLSAVPVRRPHYALDREDAWTYAIEWVTGTTPDLSLAVDLPADDLAEILAALRIVPGEDPGPKLAEAARTLFGVDRLHGYQLEVMTALLEGRDALGIAPTGSGKSMCFQLPALLHPDQRPFVVVSPLVALIKDQVDGLRSQRGLRGVQGITGKTTASERTEILRDLADGRVRLLYVSPERLVRDPNLRGALAQVDLGALVVDEAHCISSWGHDFRPEFRQVASALRGMRRAPRLGLTATATDEVAEDVRTTLDMAGDTLVLRQPVDRPDLRFWVRRVGNDAERTRELLRFVAFQGDRPGIVYASRRALTEELAWILRQAGVTARAYHADLVPEQREAIQDDFLSDTTQVIVATKAFGMGVNKPDIGWVVHYDLPESLESYAQEAGRAARSPELTGDCVLLFHGGDIARRERHVRQPAIDQNLDLARHLLRIIAGRPRRGGEHVFDPEDVAELADVTPEVLNVALAWIERSGAVERRPDCSARGHVTVGVREPEGHDERRLFTQLFRDVLRARAGSRKLIEIDELASRVALDPDDLERMLIDWSLQRLVTFQSTRRLWRVRPLAVDIPVRRFTATVERWHDLERRRCADMRDYAEAVTCRRTLIAKVFGDDPSDCTTAGALPCDVCAGGDPPWHAVPLSRVPDPEDLVDVELVVLQAAAWSSRLERAGYSEANLTAALCGRELAAGGRPMSPGLLSCPQFGALRYVRGNERRVAEAIDELTGAGLVEREAREFQGRAYRALVATGAGRARLGGRRA